MSPCSLTQARQTGPMGTSMQMSPDEIGKGVSASFFKMDAWFRWVDVPSSRQFPPVGAINPPKTCLYLVASRHYRPTHSTKGLQCQYYAAFCVWHTTTVSLYSFPRKASSCNYKPCSIYLDSWWYSFTVLQYRAHVKPLTSTVDGLRHSFSASISTIF